jgi:NAD(P)H-hydrate epimerase
MSSSAGSERPQAQASLSFLDGTTAAAVDEALMGSEVQYTLDELVELAGLACAQAVQRCYPHLRKDAAASSASSSHKQPRVLVVCGPGNNGADGLTAARHLCQFGYDVTVLYGPKEVKKELYKKLLAQLAAHDVPVVREWPEGEEGRQFHLIVDAVFGFSFDPSGGIRDPYASLIRRMADAARTGVPVASIDVPSGWDVQKGDTGALNGGGGGGDGAGAGAGAAGGGGGGLQPELLISLTAPKQCARHFTGKFHYLGGRFVPPKLLHRFGITLPAFEGAEQIVDLTQHLTKKQQDAGSGSDKA